VDSKTIQYEHGAAIQLTAVISLHPSWSPEVWKWGQHSDPYHGFQIHWSYYSHILLNFLLKALITTQWWESRSG